jgi:hypothetical protein
MKSSYYFFQRLINYLGDEYYCQLDDQIDDKEDLIFLQKVIKNIGEEGKEDEDEPFCGKE